MNSTAGPQHEVILGVDLGSSATKVVAIDRAFAARGTVERGYPMHGGPNGEAVHDPDQVLRAAITAVRDCAQQCAAFGLEVVGISFSAAMHTLMALDVDLAPLTPALSWADARAAATAKHLRVKEGGRLARDLHTVTGTPVHPMAPMVKLAWFREHEPLLHENAVWWCGLKDYVLYRFSGRFVTDHSCASATGLLDIHTLAWHTDALAVAGIKTSQLPELVDPLTVAALSAAMALELGLPPGLPITVGAGDGPLANLGVGAVAPGTAALSVGTSGALRVVRDGPAVDARCQVFSYALADGLWVIGGAVSNGGLVAQWAADNFDVADVGELLAKAATLPPEFDGLVSLPYLLSERAPWWDPDPRGALLGLRREHGPAAITRALVDGVARQLAMVRDSVLSTGAAVDTVLATGGALRSPFWADVLAAALESPIRVAQTDAGSAAGAALLGWRSLGSLDSLANVPPAAYRTVNPDAEMARRLSATRHLHQRAYQVMREFADEQPS